MDSGTAANCRTPRQRDDHICIHICWPIASCSPCSSQPARMRKRCPTPSPARGGTSVKRTASSGTSPPPGSSTQAQPSWHAGRGRSTSRRSCFRELPWFGRYKSAGEIALFMDSLYRRGGYHLTDRHDNSFCQHCTEVLLTRWPQGEGWGGAHRANRTNYRGRGGAHRGNRGSNAPPKGWF